LWFTVAVSTSPSRCSTRALTLTAALYSTTGPISLTPDGLIGYKKGFREAGRREEVRSGLQELLG
jgi:hypothetical protein